LFLIFVNIVIRLKRSKLLKRSGAFSSKRALLRKSKKEVLTTVRT
jgi:hypothetical protein